MKFSVWKKEDRVGLIRINEAIVIYIPNVHKTDQDLCYQDIKLIVSQ